ARGVLPSLGAPRGRREVRRDDGPGAPSGAVAPCGRRCPGHPRLRRRDRRRDASADPHGAPAILRGMSVAPSRTILLTNDDGIDAPGLAALERSLSGLG